ASPASLEGLRVEPGRHLLAAADAPEWVEAILRLLDDPALRQRLGSAGRQYVERHHRWGRCLEPFGRLLGLPAHPAEADPQGEQGLETEPAPVSGQGTRP